MKSIKLLIAFLFFAANGMVSALEEPQGSDSDTGAEADIAQVQKESEISHTQRIKSQRRSLFNELSPIMQAGGYSVGNVREFKPTSNPRPIDTAIPTQRQQAIIESARKIAKDNPTLALILAEKGKILFETYNAPADQATPLLSWSMSKSLAAYTIGNMHCSGIIGSLDDQAANYTRLLSGTVYGEATVRDLLKMSSGAGRVIANGEKKVDAWPAIRQRSYTIRQYISDFHKREIGPFGPIKSGSTFVYSNLDTSSLGFVAESNGGFANNFERFIWARIGAESAAYWTLDRERFALTYSGFHAVARDWVRLAMFSLSQLNSNDSCIKKFMQMATTRQISNHGDCCRTFKSYGYQTWVADFGPRQSFWWVGYGGQRIGIDPKTEQILVVFSWAEDYMDQVYDLFARWQRD